MSELVDSGRPARSAARVQHGRDLAVRLLGGRRDVAAARDRDQHVGKDVRRLDARPVLAGRDEAAVLAAAAWVTATVPRATSASAPTRAGMTPAGRECLLVRGRRPGSFTRSRARSLCGALGGDRDVRPAEEDGRACSRHLTPGSANTPILLSMAGQPSFGVQDLADLPARAPAACRPGPCRTRCSPWTRRRPWARRWPGRRSSSPGAGRLTSRPRRAVPTHWPSDFCTAMSPPFAQMKGSDAYQYLPGK